MASVMSWYLALAPCTVAVAFYQGKRRARKLEEEKRRERTRALNLMREQEELKKKIAFLQARSRGV